MCACEMPLCIFRKFFRGRQPKYFYCTAGTVSCWSVGKKKKKRKGKGEEDLRLAHRLKWLMPSWAWRAIALSWESSVTVSIPSSVPLTVSRNLPGKHSLPCVPWIMPPGCDSGRSSRTQMQEDRRESISVKTGWDQSWEGRQVTWGPPGDSFQSSLWGVDAAPSAKELWNNLTLEIAPCSSECIYTPPSQCAPNYCQLWIGTLFPLHRWVNWGSEGHRAQKQWSCDLNPDFLGPPLGSLQAGCFKDCSAEWCPDVGPWVGWGRGPWR